MQRLKKILVCLDLTEMDEVLMQYSTVISEIMGSEKVFFMHVTRSPEIPKAIKDKYFELLPPENETILKRINSCMASSFENKRGIETQIELQEGMTTTAVAEFVQKNDIDLVIVGRKINLVGKGITPQKLVRYVSCSVLFVPEKNPKKINIILAPIDFSEQSKKALRQAIKIAEKNAAALIFQNVYIVPSGYHTTGKSYEEFAEIMKIHAQEDFEKFIEKFDFGYLKTKSVYTLDNDKRPADKIYMVAKKENADLIVIGAKGKTAGATILLGSVTERLALYDVEIPLLIVKDKKESMNFLNAILNV